MNDLTIRPYQPSDYNALIEWLKIRSIKPWNESSIPKIGYVAHVDYLGLICMGFLRMVEGNSAMIDGLCSNPNMHSHYRDEAIDKLVCRIMDKAQELKLDGIISFSEDKNTLERSKKFGFEHRPNQIVIAIDLRR